jgi:pyroglutamyl-peptidase
MTERSLPTLLLTAFGPFGGDGYNPTQHALDPVAEAAAGHARVVTEVLPVEYTAACDRIRALIRAHHPDVVVSLGLAAGRTAITPERVAINLAEARIPDEAGAQPLGLALVDGAHAAHFSTLPVASMVEAVAAVDVPAAVSYSAGTFVCNAVMYAALEEIHVMEESRAPKGEGAAGSPTEASAVAGFIHVPQATEAIDAADATAGKTAAHGGVAAAGEGASRERPSSLPQADIDRGLAAAVRAAVEHRGQPPVSPQGALDAETREGRVSGIGATD